MVIGQKKKLWMWERDLWGEKGITREGDRGVGSESKQYTTYMYEIVKENI